MNDRNDLATAVAEMMKRGDAPSFVEILDHDLARVHLGAEKDGDKFFVVTTPSQEAAEALARAQRRVALFREREAKGEAFAWKDLDAAEAAAKKAAVAWLADVILEVGEGVVVRRPIGDWLKAGDRFPVPSSVHDAKNREALLWGALSTDALQRIRFATTFLEGRVAADFFAGRGSGNG